MPSSIEDALQEAAARPSEDPDFDTIMAGGRRLRIRRRANVGLGITCVAAAAVLGFNVSFNSTPNKPPASAPSQSINPFENGAIAFVRVEPEEMIPEGATPSPDLYKIEPEGDPRLMLKGTAYRNFPSWSPDGSKIAFHGDRGIYVADADGENVTKVMACSEFEFCGSPAWSPDGSRIALGRTQKEVDGLWVLDVESREPSLVTDGITVIGSPTWAPDSRSIIIIGETRSGYKLKQRLVKVSVDDGTTSLLETAQQIVLGDSVAWSPDGESLVLEVAGEAPGIFVIKIESGETKLLTSCVPEEDCLDVYPTWSPDGRQILFTRGLCSEPGSDCFTGDLFVIDADGGNLDRITSGPALDCCAAWQPLPP